MTDLSADEWMARHGNDYPCAQCKAEPGQPCDVKRGRSRWHAPRIDRALAAMRKQR